MQQWNLERSLLKLIVQGLVYTINYICVKLSKSLIYVTSPGSEEASCNNCQESRCVESLNNRLKFDKHYV